jgi:transcriptional regulator with XRE-family HTH domain
LLLRKVNPVEAKSACIGQRIRRARLVRKMTQESLSEMCGVNASYIGQIERGEKQPSLRTLTAICRSLRVDLSSLLEADTSEPDAAVQELLAVVCGCPAEVVDVVTQHARVVVSTFQTLRSPAGSSGHSGTTDS